MTDLYLNEYGKNLYLDVDYAISSATAINVKFSCSAGSVTIAGSALGANYTSSACGTVFSAGRAIVLTFASGDFSATGADTYVGWAEVTFSGSKLVSSTFAFTVSNPGG